MELIYIIIAGIMTYTFLTAIDGIGRELSKI